MTKGHKHWNNIETIKLQRLFMAKMPMKEIYKQFPEYSQKRIYSKLTRLFPESFDIHTTRTERNHEKLEPINWGKVHLRVVEIAKNKLAGEFQEINGSYYINGKRILVQDLIELSKKKG